MDRPINILFIGNGPNSNRGCEAIVRGSIEILKKEFGEITCTNIYNLVLPEPEIEIEDTGVRIKQFANIVRPRNHLNRIVKGLLIRFAPSIWTKLFLSHLISYIKEADIVLSIGGDNYSLDYGIPRIFTGLDNLVLSNKKPMVIWGASVGPFSKIPEYEKYMIEHLKRINGIFARETATVKYLADKGVTENVFRVADPAFLMEAKEPKKKIRYRNPERSNWNKLKSAYGKIRNEW